MNTKKSYYLFVPAENIYHKITDNADYHIDNKIATMVFEEYHIPKKYQHIVIHVTINGMVEPVDATEPLTKKLFAFKTSFLKALINPTANPVIELFSNDIGIVTENNIYNPFVIKEFYQEIIDNNLAGKYDNAIREILNMPREKDKESLITKTKKLKY